MLRSTQSLEAEVEEMRAALLLHGAGAWRPGGGGAAKRAARAAEAAGAEARTVCVTGGTSFLGFAVVDCLLRHGYDVRLAIETQGQLVLILLPFTDWGMLQIGCSSPRISFRGGTSPGVGCGCRTLFLNSEGCFR